MKTIENCKARIKGLLLLDKDWDKEDSFPPNKQAAEIAKTFIKTLSSSNLLPKRITPIEGSGGIIINYRVGQKMASLEILNEESDTIARTWHDFKEIHWICENDSEQIQTTADTIHEWLEKCKRFL